MERFLQICARELEVLRAGPLSELAALLEEKARLVGGLQGADPDRRGLSRAREENRLLLDALGTRAPVAYDRRGRPA